MGRNAKRKEALRQVNQDGGAGFKKPGTKNVKVLFKHDLFSIFFLTYFWSLE
jgi:hypothetical protein